MKKLWPAAVGGIATCLSAIKGADFSPLKNLATTLAILVGGCWTLHEYHATLKPKLAAAQLADLSRDAVNISVAASSFPTETSTARTLIVRVRVENQGACHASLSLDRGWQPLYVAHVHYVGDRMRPRTGEEFFPQSYAILFLTGEHVPIAVLNVPAKTTRELGYYVQVQEPGIYFVRFHSPTSLSPPCGPEGGGIRPPEPPDFDFGSRPDRLRDLLAQTRMWHATTFVVVP